METKKLEDVLRDIYLQTNSLFGNGDFYQDFPSANINGSRSCEKRMKAYKISEFLSGGDSVLDIGCNTGFLSMEISHHVNDVHGFDNDVSSIAVANTAKTVLNNNKCTFDIGDFEYMSAINKKYNAIFCLAIFEWMIKKVGMENFLDQLERISEENAIIFYESHHLADDVCVRADSEQINAFLNRGYKVLHTEVFVDDCKRKITVLQK